MTLEEAIQIRGIENAPRHLVAEAARVMALAQAMARAQRREGEFGMSRIERERINSLLAYRLALACGKFDDWRQAA